MPDDDSLPVIEERNGDTDTTPEYITNRDLFSNHYLISKLPETDVWESVDDEELEEVYEEILELYERRRNSVDQYNESMLEQRFVRPILDILDVDYGVEETVQNARRRPDYGFFASDAAVDRAFDRTNEGGDFYKDAVAVADAKKWGLSLDTQSDDRHTFENPSFQISVYLDETPVEWAVLTNGESWRLYYSRTSHRLDSFYEINLPEVLDACDPTEDDGLEPFKYFYLFFRKAAFVCEEADERFLDRVLHQSNLFSRELGADLKKNIYDAIGVLADGLLEYHENDVDEDDLDLIHDASLVYLYRLIFVLYAESEGRDLLNTNNDYYRERFSLNELKTEIAENRDDPDHEYPTWDDDLWNRLVDLFELIDEGSEAKGIPEEDLYVPAYNGGLFRTDPDEDDPRESHFLKNNKVSDQHLAEVIELLTRSEAGSNGEGETFVDYSSLDIRHLGSIYEGLLEYQLNIADEDLAVDDGEYVSADDDDKVVVDEGDVYLTTDSGERRATGSYYTPDYVVEYIVENTLAPLTDDIRASLVGQSAFDEGGFAEEFAEEVFDLKVLDPAMGSGHFLVDVIDYLAREIIDAQQRQAEQEDDPDIDKEHDIHWARRQVAQRCVYGVDVNHLAVELAKVSLWLRTLAAEQPLAFLDHHLKSGNSLLGSNVEDIDELDADREEIEVDDDGQTQSTFAKYGAVRKGTIGHMMRIYQDIIAIENQERADAKEMEDKYREIEKDKIRNRLVEMANVHTAEEFGIDVPDNVYRRIVAALEDDDRWEDIADKDWFKAAQSVAEERNFFHWRLAFPEAFYDIEGEEKDNPGFDVVVGNPPYVSNWQLTEVNEELPEILESMYPEVTTGHWDLYVPFAYRGTELTRDDGYHSFITPNALATEKYGVDLREYFVNECNMKQLVTFEEFQVFDDVDRQYLIYIVSPQDVDGECDIVLFDGHEFVPQFSMEQETFLTYSNNSFRVDLTADDMEVKSDVDEKSILLGELCFVNPGVVAHSAEDSPLDFSKDDVVDDQPGDGKKMYLDGGSDIQRYHLDWSGKYIDYESKQEHFHRPKFPEQFESPKIIFARVSGADNAIKSCYDDEGYYTNDNALHAVQWTPEIEEHRQSNNYESLDNVDEYDLRYAAALVNSRLASYYFSHFLATDTLQGSYSGVYPEDVRQLPVRTIDFETPADEREQLVDRAMETFEDVLANNADIIELVEVIEEADHNDVLHDVLGQLASRIIELNEMRSAINLNLMDYLGDYSNTRDLQNQSGYQPASDVSDSMLAENSNTYDSLRVGTLTVEESGGKLTIGATPRFKPENKDDYDDDMWTEPDRWDYIERKQTIPAVEFAGISEERRAFIRAFIETVEERDDGFAGFHEEARSTISLLRRIREIELPDFDDVSDGFDQYLDSKQRADDLSRRADVTNEVIDRLVYWLYDLDEDEITLVESTG